MNNKNGYLQTRLSAYFFNIENMEICSLCTICGAKKKVIRHHVDYEKDIVIPLCRSCHKKLHNGSFANIPIPAPSHPHKGRYRGRYRYPKILKKTINAVIRFRNVNVKDHHYKKHKVNHFPVDTLIKNGLTAGKFKLKVSSLGEDERLWGWLILEE